jgi:hypothetical protein
MSGLNFGKHSVKIPYRKLIASCSPQCLKLFRRADFGLLGAGNGKCLTNPLPDGDAACSCGSLDLSVFRVSQSDVQSFSHKAVYFYSCSFGECGLKVLRYAT